VVDDVPKWRFVKNLPKVFKGTHIHEKGLSIRSARSVTVRSNPVIRFAIDGDREFESPARVSVLPGALRLMSAVKPRSPAEM